MLDIKEIDGGIEFEVIAKPKASRNAIEGIHDGALKISVTAAPEKGKANTAIIKLLARTLQIPVSNITILTGESSRRKRLSVMNVPIEALLSAVAGGIS